ncbi:predicted protein [Plenodomus lingam JN3]|uniref:Predicted protein n=1 Tax=Leptosphaeria maculans (strain JN3 / isolate v23.1.3 / race Av1-4-5-6-7-8) TaxID=985895 RepID=E5ADB7_LEPMJ|nr:predicted protein [Plenodomus lingam JN3]CBY02469.1 predicted protein [Plenodomus lingam JN3]
MTASVVQNLVMNSVVVEGMMVAIYPQYISSYYPPLLIPRFIFPSLQLS